MLSDSLLESLESTLTHTRLKLLLTNCSKIHCQNRSLHIFSRIVTQFERARKQAKDLNASFLTELAELLNHRYSIETLMSKLQAEWIASLSPEQAREERLRIWNQLKLEVVSKTVASVYATSLLSVLIAVEMAVIAKYLYLRSLFIRDKIDPDEFLPGLENVATIGKAIMTIATQFASSGAETIDTAVGRATSLVLSRVDVQQPVSRSALDDCVCSIRHEIEDAAGRDIIEEALLGHDAISGVFQLIPCDQRPLANSIISAIKTALSSPILKHTLASLVNKKLSSIIGVACEELYNTKEEPLLLSIIPNINAEFKMIMSPKAFVEDDALLTTLMAAVFRSVEPQNTFKNNNFK